MLDAKSKYRLIGAGLLLGSSAILLPLILDGERPESLDVQISVPERPEFPEVAIAPVQPVSEMEIPDEPVDVNSIELLPSDPETQPVKPVAKEPVRVVSEPVAKPAGPVLKVTKEPVPIGERWTLQVATFGKQDNATRTLKKLKDAGYPAYVMTTNSLFKVFVGPELKREESEKMKQKVQKEFKLSGIVVKYSPNS
ncbi:MAG: SPOR domain-containing protein [Pseudomonadota bacterium]|nr:SPOR domain-containing protein [Pseudomonadota bacterium]